LLRDPRQHGGDDAIAVRLAEHECLRRSGAGPFEQMLLDCVTRSSQPRLDDVFRHPVVAAHQHFE
jgi:hypothetical protein